MDGVCFDTILMSLKSIHRKVLESTPLTDSDIRFLIDLPSERLGDMLACAHTIRSHFFGDTVSLCAIINAKSGTCSEDCAFCAQSGHNTATSPEYPLLPLDQILTSGKAAQKRGVTRFGIVASGKLVSQKDIRDYATAVSQLAQLGLSPDLSPGILTAEQLNMLKQVGLKGYHHNLETSATYFPNICTTHDYQEDVNAVRDAVKAGLYVCSGGIFGIGETWDDRVELAQTVRELGVQSVPINFLNPIPGTAMETRPVLTPEEALKIVALYRFLLPDRALRICGGRLTVFGEARRKELLTSGANGLMVGDYLTTKGGDVDADLRELRAANLQIETR